MSEKGMKMLLSRGKLPELKSIDFDMCESCILEKQKNVSFLKIGRTPKVGLSRSTRHPPNPPHPPGTDPEPPDPTALAVGLGS